MTARSDRPWWKDSRMLDAGDVQRLRPPTPPAPTPDQRARVTPDVSGDLDAAAARLGLPVADLVRIRRDMGLAPQHRRPGPLARLIGWIRRS